MATYLLPVSVLVSLPFLFLWSHYLRPVSQWRTRWDCVVFVGLYCGLGLLQVAEHFIFIFSCIEKPPGAPINAASSLLFPLSLAVLLYLFIAHRTKNFRFVCIYLLFINLSIAALTCVQRQSWFGEIIPRAYQHLFETRSTYAVLFGTALLFVDIVILVWLYRVTKSLTISHFWRVAIPLLFALSFDSFWFSAVIAYLTSASYFDVMPPHLASKLFMGLMYSLCLFLHFKWRDQEWINGQSEEHPITFLLSVFYLDKFIRSGGVIRVNSLTPTEPSDSLPVSWKSTTPVSTCMELKVTFVNELPTPRAVKQLLELLAPREQIRANFEARLKVSFYYGGQNIAYRETENGMEIIAFGQAEYVIEAVNNLSSEEAEKVIICVPEPFAKHAREVKDLPQFRER